MIFGFAKLAQACVMVHVGASAVAAPVKIDIAHVFEGEALQVENVALRTHANTLSVTRLAYLISNVELVRADGSVVPSALDAAFVHPTARKDSMNEGARTSFAIGDVPEGEYVGVRFTIGLPKELNHANPAQFGPSHPLNPNVNNLHWNWQGGYIFFAIEGRWVQSDDSLGGYVYHVAGEPLLMRIDLASPFVVQGPTTLELELDVEHVFSGEHAIALTSDTATHTTHSGEGDTLAPKLAANVAGAFSFVRAREDAEHLAANASELGRHISAAQEIPAGTTAYNFQAPAHFPQVELPSDNPLTNEGVALGKRLFFDVQLSGNNAQSCASCHVPARAFADGETKGIGAYGDVGPRNTMPLFNLAWSQRAGYTWDGRKQRVRDQALQPIEDTREMRQSLESALAKLGADETYPAEFERAFGSPGIDANRLSLALEQYLLTLVSAGSKFDRVQAGKEQFSATEQRGFELFMGEYDPARGQLGADCFHCHGGALFSDYQFHANGIDALDEMLAQGATMDAGRRGVTDRAIDAGKFKTPSLRNVALTGPYMHDGRFATILEVLTHYSEGVKPSKPLDANLAKHLRANEQIAGAEGHAGVNLSEGDKAALEAFLHTLTDEEFAGGAKQPTP
jgi:cytochrome c peroxidase